jgi:transposase
MCEFQTLNFDKMSRTTPAFDYFLGIDFSKASLDLCLIDYTGKKLCKPFKVTNDLSGYTRILQKLDSVKELEGHRRAGELKARLLVVVDNTGRYSQLISHLFSKDNWQFGLESPLQIKLSSGVIRGKNDVADAYRIALYGKRHEDLFVPYQPNSKTLLHLDALLKKFEKVKRIRTSYILSCKSINQTLEEIEITEDDDLIASDQQLIASLDRRLEVLENKMLELIQSDAELNKQAQLLTSITSIGLKTARAMIVYTCGFTRLTSAASFKSYCGVAPFEYQSGTSVRGRTKVHQNANKHLKSLLHMCAMRAIRLEGELQDYYNRKVAEGKNKMLVLNNIRAKLIDRIVAVVNRGTPYKKLVRDLTLS